jgi:hypothetical protein
MRWFVCLATLTLEREPDLCGFAAGKLSVGAGARYAERPGGRRHRLTSERGRAISSACCRADAARLRDDSVFS